MVTGSGKKAVQNSTFKWVNTLLGNLKNSVAGTYHAIREKHVPRYLAQFQYRFNRRYRLGDMIPRLAWVALRTPPMPYRLLKLAEVCWLSNRALPVKPLLSKLSGINVAS